MKWVEKYVPPDPKQNLQTEDEEKQQKNGEIRRTTL